MACTVDFNRLRALALEIQRRVDTLYDAVHAIHTVTHPWVLNKYDYYLPTVTAVKLQLAAYKVLGVVQITLSDTIREIELCDNVIPEGVLIPLTGIIFPADNPIMF